MHCTWSCTGEQSALAVSHYSLMVLVGLQGAHTNSERQFFAFCVCVCVCVCVCMYPWAAEATRNWEGYK